MVDSPEHSKEQGDSVKAEDDKRSEDVEIDLGKITGFFKRKKAENREDAAADGGSVNGNKRSGSEGSESDEIDFGKAISGIKGIFKELTKGKKEGGYGGDEEAADLSSAIKFVSRHYITLLMILGIAVSIGLGFSLRMQSGDLAFTDNWARNSIEQTINSDISDAVSQQYPNLPEKNKEKLISEELDKARQSGTYTFKTGQYKGQIVNIGQQTQAISQQFKSFFQDESGRNYMPDIDPYYWWRYARNIVETGHLEDEVRNGFPWDNHQFAPVGRGMSPEDTFYPKAIAAFYKVAKVLKPDTELVRALMFFPVFISALTILLVFLIAKRMAGNIAAFFAATMVGVNASLISRTQFGHADSDAIAVFFSVLILWLFIESFYTKRITLKIAFAALSGLATLLYSLTWGGWWWILDFILAAFAAAFGLFVLHKFFFEKKGSLSTKALHTIRDTLKDKTARRAATTMIAYYLSGVIFFAMFSSAAKFIITPFASLGFRAIKAPVVASSAPNVLRTVAELNEGTVNQAISQIGSSIYYIAVLGIILLIARAALEAYKKERDMDKVMRDLFYAAVLAIWFIATLYAVTKGVRFILLLVPAVSIAFGVFFGMFTTYTARWLNKEFRLNKIAITAVIFLILFMVFPGPTFNSNAVQAARNVVNNDIPLVNDAWYNALKSIKDSSKEDAIITSWWDFGHHFKALADRPVTFDGTTQLSPQAHWVGRFFSTSNEQEAIGILRMLNCGANTAPQELSRIKTGTTESAKGVLLAKRILMLGREEAKKVLLEEGLNEQQAGEVLELTHCQPPESFVIASEDMIGKSGVWGHFGAWNFTKADIWKAANEEPRERALKYMKDEHGMSDEEAESIFTQMQGISDDRAADAWLGQWNGLAGGAEGCGVSGELLMCGDGLTVNLTNYNAWYPASQGNLHPVSISYPTADGKVVRKTFENNTIPQQLSVLLIPAGDSYARVIGSTEIIDGMFARMFYLRGHGLKHFKLLTRQRGFTGTDVWVWQVDWEGKQENIMEELRPVEEKTEVGTGDNVKLNYIGYFENGTVFDSSIRNFRSKGITNETVLDNSHDYNPLNIIMGTNSVIPGFERGVLEARVNEEKVIVVNPEEGYTEPEHPLFNQTLYFRIKVTDIK